MSLITHMKRIIPNVALSTDIIVGFPTETDDEFNDTVQVCSQVEFDHAYIFKYSQRPNTRAALKFVDDVPKRVKTERITQLVAMQKEWSRQRNQRWVGLPQSLLIERVDAVNGQVVGRNDANVLTYVPHNAPNSITPGDWVTATPTRATPHGLTCV